MEKKEKKIKTWLLVLLFSLILGFLGGVFSYIYSYKNFYSLFPFSQELDLNSWDYGGTNFIIQDAKKVVINQDLKIEENIAYLSEATVGVFKKNEVSQDLYFFEDSILNGLVISSDGWVFVNIVGLPSFDKNILKNEDEYVIISKKNKKIYEIENLTYSEKDALLLLKIKGIDNFPVKSFYNFSDLKVGQSLLSYTFSGQIDPVFLMSKNQQSGIVNIDKFSNSLIFNKKQDDFFRNSFVFDLNGDLVALTSFDLEVYPMSDFKPLIFNFFKNKEIKKAKFGISYINISNVLSTDNDFYSEGAWVYNNGLSAVEKGGLFDLAGLKTGDIIIRVNDYKVDSNNDLFDILNNFVIGDKLSLYVLRDDSFIDLKVDLK
ncbi:hypothetical protein CVU82_00690 [Candidatus Falkowbacteria bacterium HGW-Falkowbacteria-1]|uniref:PDZ domain-containing protein n=1 Tax=Candidatus Falkowbacteria bacterium HGW-Falkowbacteria-1 TaxID=2013768 RepID=A0A2N2EAF4_9BACT|nr:MAG: hypothetical protein CVU82_00690 [Candidatus Falkowbacteria bacterium HGW-Falkowbacteria-1]